MSLNPLLNVTGLKAGYGAAQVLFGVDLSVAEGEVITLLGRNGMGRSTTIKCLFGLLEPKAGEITFADKRTEALPSHQIAQLGLGLVPEGRQIFPNLTVEENLVATARANAANGLKHWSLERVYKFFPRLQERRLNMGSQLSGGEQQMLAIGRALMSNPDILLCDELSLGLAPIVIREIYQAMPVITAEGMTVVIVEQDVTMARQVSQRLYCFQEGRVSLQGTSSELSREQISQAYFGV